MALMKDEDGRLWDVDLNGKKHSPNFGQEVGSELIDGLPLAMGIAKTVLKGMDKGLAAMSSKRANAILSDEEKAQLEKARAEAKQKDKEQAAKAKGGLLGDFMQIASPNHEHAANVKALREHYKNILKKK